MPSGPGHSHTQSHWAYKYAALVFSAILFIACEVALWLPADGRASQSAGAQAGSQALRGTVMGLIATPWALGSFLLFLLGFVVGREGLTLQTYPGHLPAHVVDAVQKAWSYERDRYRRSLKRAGWYASAFGTVATLLLAVAALLAKWRAHVVRALDDGASAGMLDAAVLGLAVSVGAAVTTAFAIHFVRILVRLSSHEINARGFSWATRAVVLIAVADAGLLIALQAWDAPGKAVLLGIFVAVAGEHAIGGLLERAPKVLGLARPDARAPSPLLGLMPPEHVERLEEEGILSLHDLAFTPTARLFFNTPYGLPKICEWQDEALLSVQVGLEHARDLFNQMGIRRATALREVAEAVLGSTCDSTATVHALRSALKLTEDLPLEPMLRSIRGDEAVLRLDVHRRSVVREPAHFSASPEAERQTWVPGEPPSPATVP